MLPSCSDCVTKLSSFNWSLVNLCLIFVLLHFRISTGHLLVENALKDVQKAFCHCCSLQKWVCKLRRTDWPCQYFWVKMFFGDQKVGDTKGFFCSGAIEPGLLSRIQHQKHWSSIFHKFCVLGSAGSVSQKFWKHPRMKFWSTMVLRKESIISLMLWI